MGSFPERLYKVLPYLCFPELFQAERTPEMILIGSGAKTIGVDILQQLNITTPIITDEVLDQGSLNCFSAFAVAQLLIRKEYMTK